jgi:molybdopterin-containing oxidoreductase family iron-sulfur binding subunit
MVLNLKLRKHKRIIIPKGRHEVIKEVTLDEFKKNPKLIVEQRMQEIGNYGGIDNYEKDGTLYPVYDRPGIKWGMSIDLNSCFGCGACVSCMYCGKQYTGSW